MSSLVRLESQSKFPYEDLTDANAEMLGLLLGNTDLIAKGHMAAEKTRQVFKVGHQSILRATRRLDYDGGQEKALDKGTSMFEAMSAMVNPTPKGTSALRMRDISGALTDIYDEERVRQYFMDAYECLKKETPRTAEVIRSASRLSPAMAERAVLGAAVARHFEIDTANAA